MIYKLVILNVFCVSKPCSLTIVSNNGNVIKKVTLKAINSKICFCTKEQSFKLIARYSNQTIYKTMCINNLRCQNIFVNFVFNSQLSQRISSEIKLLDANYGFPVTKAVLNFKLK